MTEKSVDDGLPDMSMRKLTMKLKEKLEITKKPSKNENDNKVVMLGLDAAGKTTILYKLHIGEVLSTVPTIENIESETKLVVLRDDDVKMIEKSVDDVKMTEKSVDDGLHDMSILTRMLKEKREITKRTSKNENDNTVVKLGLDAAGKTYSSNLSPSKDSASVTMKRVVFSENCESESKLVIMRDNDVKMTEKSVDDGLHDRSMRKLTMMLKEKLEITRKPSKNENDNKTSARTAPQVTSENRILGHPMDF